jgi:hypothetical protein
VGALGLRHWRTRTQSGACDSQTVPKQRFGRSYEASSPTRTPHAIVFASHPLTMRANTTQKAYDEAFLACSTAVYFEGQVRVLSHAQRRHLQQADTSSAEKRERGSALLEDCSRPHLLPQRPPQSHNLPPHLRDR